MKRFLLIFIFLYQPQCWNSTKFWNKPLFTAKHLALSLVGLTSLASIVAFAISKKRQESGEAQAQLVQGEERQLESLRGQTQRLKAGVSTLNEAIKNKEAQLKQLEPRFLVLVAKYFPEQLKDTYGNWIEDFDAKVKQLKRELNVAKDDWEFILSYEHSDQKINEEIQEIGSFLKDLPGITSDNFRSILNEKQNEVSNIRARLDDIFENKIGFETTDKTTTIKFQAQPFRVDESMAISHDFTSYKYLDETFSSANKIFIKRFDLKQVIKNNLSTLFEENVDIKLVRTDDNEELNQYFIKESDVDNKIIQVIELPGN